MIGLFAGREVAVRSIASLLVLLIFTLASNIAVSTTNDLPEGVSGAREPASVSEFCSNTMPLYVIDRISANWPITKNLLAQSKTHQTLAHSQRRSFERLLGHYSEKLRSGEIPLDMVEIECLNDLRGGQSAISHQALSYCDELSRMALIVGRLYFASSAKMETLLQDDAFRKEISLSSEIDSILRSIRRLKDKSLLGDWVTEFHFQCVHERTRDG